MLDKIKQLFCRHKDTQQMREVTPFYNLSGQRVYTVCKKCGKVINSVFYEYEGSGYK